MDVVGFCVVVVDCVFEEVVPLAIFEVVDVRFRRLADERIRRKRSIRFATKMKICIRSCRLSRAGAPL